MKKEVGSFEAKSKLAELLRYVQNTNEEVIITIRGHKVAKLSPFYNSSPVMNQTIQAIKRFRKGKKLETPLKNLISQGRK